VRRVFFDHAPQAIMDDEEPRGELRLPVGRKRAAGEEAQAISLERHHAPAGPAQAGVDAEDANHVAHDDPVDSPAGGNSLDGSRRSPALDVRRAVPAGPGDREPGSIARSAPAAPVQPGVAGPLAELYALSFCISASETSKLA
jgi:hypothetical protein